MLSAVPPGVANLPTWGYILLLSSAHAALTCPAQPLTMAAIGRRLWVKYRFTNKRLIVTTSSPIFQREVRPGTALTEVSASPGLLCSS